MILGYNTNGWAHHDPLQAIEVLAELGYRGVAITVDHGCLNPADARTPQQLVAIQELLQKYNMRSVIETGARFLLDPRQKHEPTLVSARPEDRQRRTAFLLAAVDMAKTLASDCVSLWSGVARDAVVAEVLHNRLASELRQVLDYAGEREVLIGFEPEPGMAIDTMASFENFLHACDAPNLRLTLDVGHLHCQQEFPLADVIRKWGPRIVNIHMEDMRVGIHEHLQFGEGEIEFAPVFQALRDIDYRHGIYVELSRHSHMAPMAARQAISYLQRHLLDQGV
ncbi:MAG: sugar phosphate isomerase/epimerase [Planctomycetota bacterium]|nr:sugar phosphate isomerase/epimerase [Planctomycetota bacterium]